MKKTKADKVSELRAEYDFTGGVRGKYAARMKQGSVVVILEPDVAAKFATSKDVNKALRSVLGASKSPSSRKRPSKSKAKRSRAAR